MQLANAIGSLPKVVIFSGGTMVHIRPHLSVCAPAFGKVGHEIEQALYDWYAKHINAFETFLEEELNYGNILNLSAETITHYQTRMADSESPIITNDDLAGYLDEVLADKSVKCIVMAAAVCDYEPDKMETITGCMIDNHVDFGKKYPRLHDVRQITVRMKQTDKLVDRIKQCRPDIKLISFKTTSDETIEELIGKCSKNERRNDSDIVFGNDIANKYNILVTRFSTAIYDNRTECIGSMVDQVMQDLLRVG